MQKKSIFAYVCLLSLTPISLNSAAQSFNEESPSASPSEGSIVRREVILVRPSESEDLSQVIVAVSGTVGAAVIIALPLIMVRKWLNKKSISGSSNRALNASSLQNAEFEKLVQEEFEKLSNSAYQCEQDIKSHEKELEEFDKKLGNFEYKILNGMAFFRKAN